MPLRLLMLLALVLATAAPAAEAAAAPDAGETDRLVALFNPDLFGYDAASRRPTAPITSTYTAPASDIAVEVERFTWFSVLVFLPFLVLPIVLLVYVMWRFRDRGDGRAPATFTHHIKLEVVWTAIPFAALAVVCVPMFGLIWRMELPPDDKGRDMVVEVVGKSFAWDYKYQRLGGDDPDPDLPALTVGQDVAGMQEPLVLAKDRRVIVSITSNDVNHAWWVPALGIKKDAYKGRYTSAWFTPIRTGFFKGQCAELCGWGHGVMLVSAVVVEEPDFRTWESLQRARAATAKVWTALSDEKPDAAALEAAVAVYFATDRSPARRAALAYWMAADLLCWSRKPGALILPEGDRGERVRAWIAARRALVESLAARHCAPRT